jgi:hypothetical protein
MATRLYFGNNAATKNPSGGSYGPWQGWYQTNGDTYKYQTRTAAQTPTAMDTELSYTEVSDQATYYGIAWWHTLPLNEQTINSGQTFRLQMCCREAATAQNSYLAFSISQYTDNDVNVHTYNSYIIYGATEVIPTTTASAATARTVLYTMGENWTISNNDYLVFSIGYWANNTKTTSYTTYNTYKHVVSGTDLTSGGETQAASLGYNAWVECSQTLSFYTRPANANRVRNIIVNA